MTIFCSKKLESFLGATRENTPSDAATMGNWNGHLFSIDRRKCLIFMNDKTCYTVIMLDVLKKDVQQFGHYFVHRLLRQLEAEIPLNETQRIHLRNSLGDVVLKKTNNNRSILGVINQHIYSLKVRAQLNGGLKSLNEIQENIYLNDGCVSAKIEVENRKFRNFFVPREVMADAVSALTTTSTMN